jgi:TetR/AcrR family transcriptional regulator, cholesterol catabolism regulator
MSLFARTPYDAVTVADIAAFADLTPAAVYYHFDGKEQILLEGMSDFSQELLRNASDAVAAGTEIGVMVSSLISHVRTRRTAAMVFFVTTTGLNLGFEAHRKLVRAELSELFAEAARRQRLRLTKAEAGVIGATLVSLLEVSAAAALRGERSFKTLGARRSLDVVADLARRVVGP